MAEMRGASQSNNMENWARDAKRKARELQDSARSAAGNLMRSGDLCDYLNLVCRLNYYDARNLLLILQQYPKASCLAGFKVWQKILGDPSVQVLKPEWRGKGIDLIAPYTELYGNGSYSLTWFAVKQFDISQTNVKKFTPPCGPYVRDRDHITRLISCASDVLATIYRRTVTPVSSSSQLRSAGLFGQMNEVVVLVREDISPQKRLLFLCECLCQLTLGTPEGFTSPQTDFVIQCVIYCLFRIWDIELPRPLRQNPVILGSYSSEQQLPFLSMIQRNVRHIDEEIVYRYRNLLSEATPTPPSAPMHQI